MRRRATTLALAALALAPAAAPADVEGPVTRIATVGGRADVLARADGSAIVAWESGADVHVCRIAPGAGLCAGGSERTLTPAAAGGTTTSRPFVLPLSGGRIAVIRGESAPQHTYRWVSPDEGATFAAAVDFASVVPVDMGAAVGTDDSISLLGDPPRYQLAASTGGGKASATVAFDPSAVTGAHAVAVDPATNRPFAAWSAAADTASTGASSTAPTTAGAWSPRVVLAGATGIRLSGTAATWVRDGRHEIARWNGTAFTAGVPLAEAAADTGAADVATDPAGGLHLVYNPAGTGAVCYAYAAAGASPEAPVLLGRDSEGVSGLAVSATGPGAGRVTFTTTAAAGPVSVLPLSGASLAPNVCGLAPDGLVLTRAVGRARLRVAFDPHGQDTTWRVDFGTTTDYGSSSEGVVASAAGGPVTTTVDLGALAPATVHHARLVAVNATGATTGPDFAFTTPQPAAPVRADQVIRFARRCAGRRLRVGLVAKEGARPVLALIRVRGQKPLRLGPKRLAAGAVVLTALPRRHVALTVKVRLADGRILRRSRAFVRCT